MHPFSGSAQTIENRTDGVGDAAGKQQQETGHLHYFDYLLKEGDDGPAHADIADHGKYTKDIQVNGGEGSGKQGDKINDMIRHGELTPKEAAVYPQKNVLTNALGVWLNVKCDIEAYSEKVDGFLVCSDGLYGYVSEKVLKKIVFDSDNHPVLRVKQLIKAAMNAGGFDNITAILIDLEGAGTHE